MHQWSGNNPLNAYIQANPIGLQWAQSLHHIMEQKFCHFFQPFKQYFQHHPVQYIVEPMPVSPIQGLDERVKLSTDRQMEYFRGRGVGHIQEQFFHQFLQDDRADRGLAENHRGKSLLFGNQYIYASGCTLKSMGIKGSDQTTSSQQQPINQIFCQPILQIVQLGENVVVRCRYWVHIVSPTENKLIQKIRLKQEITSVSTSGSSQCITIATFDGKQHRLYEWHPSNATLACLRTYQTYYPTHSMVPINSRELVLVQANKVYIEDVRTGDRQTLKRVAQIGNDRYCSAVMAKHHKHSIILSRAKFIDIFDIRKSNPSVSSVRHYCEQSPPTCLVAVEWVQPTLIAYSPYKTGSSLLVPLCTQQPHQILGAQQSGPQLLYDSGKVCPLLYPKSVSVQVQENNLIIIHLDSAQGICIEKLVSHPHLGILRVGTNLSAPDILLGFQNRFVEAKEMEPYFVQNASQQVDAGEEASQGAEDEIQKVNSNINYCSLDHFRNRVFKLAQAQAKSSAGLSPNYTKMRETYASSYETQSEHLFQHVLKLGSKGSRGQGVGQEMMEFLEESWKI